MIRALKDLLIQDLAILVLQYYDESFIKRYYVPDFTRKEYTCKDLIAFVALDNSDEHFSALIAEHGTKMLEAIAAYGDPKHFYECVGVPVISHDLSMIADMERFCERTIDNERAFSYLCCCQQTSPKLAAYLYRTAIGSARNNMRMIRWFYERGLQPFSQLLLCAAKCPHEAGVEYIRWLVDIVPSEGAVLAYYLRRAIEAAIKCELDQGLERLELLLEYARKNSPTRLALQYLDMRTMLHVFAQELSTPQMIARVKLLRAYGCPTSPDAMTLLCAHMDPDFTPHEIFTAEEAEEFINKVLAA